MSTTKFYRPNKLYNITNGLVLLAIIFVGLTLPLLIKDTPVETRKLIGVIGFWVIGIILTVAPFGFKLEVGDDYIRSYYLGFKILHIPSSQIKVINYTSLFRGGLGYGKGLNIRYVVNGKIKTASIGEKFYGKEAIEHAKRVLEAKGVTE